MTSGGVVLRVAAVVLFGLASAAIGAWWSRAPAALAPAAPAPCLSSEERMALRQELAQEVRRAVAAALPAQVAAAPAAPAPAAPAAGSAEAAADEQAQPSPAHEAAKRLLAEALSRGTWRPEDGQAFREVLGELKQGEMTEILDELSRAVNTGRLQLVARDRPMF